MAARLPIPDRPKPLVLAMLGGGLALAVAAGGQERPAPAAPPAPSGSLLAGGPPYAGPGGPSQSLLRQMSLFATASSEARVFQRHDLVQVIVRELSTARSEHDLETQKDWTMNGAISAWPDLQVEDLLNLIVRAGRTTDLPSLDISFDKDFDGESMYNRSDEFTARLTAEVLDVLPNGNLVLESRTRIRNDTEESLIRVTGICRPADVTPANTILSNQLHDLTVEKINRGEVKTGSSKGILTKAFEAIFAF